jgi:transcriptional regulator with XRE-family HTH domain
MRRKSLSAGQLAQQIGCHRSLLYRWLNGECLPHKPVYLQGIALACGCELPALLALMAGPPDQGRAASLEERLGPLFAQVQEPADLDQGLEAIARFFRTEEVELFLASPISVACLWRAGLHPFDPGRIGALIRLCDYAVDWRELSPHTEEEAIARAFILGQAVEFVDLRLHARRLVAAPLGSGQHLGCLVLRLDWHERLTPGQAALLREVCACLAAGVEARRQVFDSLGRVYGARVLAELYRELHGEEMMLQKGQSPLRALMGQAEGLGRLLLSLARRLRQTDLAFNDLSIQHIESDTGMMLAIGTAQGRHLRPPALFEAATAIPCWEAFKTGRPVYRPDLSKDNPYGEGDPSLPRSVRAIVDLPFAWEQGQGTVGINSLRPHPWSEQELRQLAELLDRLSRRQLSAR